MTSWFAPVHAGSLAASPTTNSTAFDHYLRGNSLLQEASQESIHAAIDNFNLAVAGDPQFGLAYASLAEAYLGLRGFGATPELTLAQSARRYADLAVQVKPDLAEAHAALGAVKQLEWVELTGGGIQLRRSLASEAENSTGTALARGPCSAIRAF